MLPLFCRQTVTRIRPGIKVERGSEIYDWENAESIDIPGCSMQPASTSLSEDGRVLGISDGFTCYMPETADVQAGWSAPRQIPQRFVGPYRLRLSKSRNPAFFSAAGNHPPERLPGSHFYQILDCIPKSLFFPSPRSRLHRLCAGAMLARSSSSSGACAKGMMWSGSHEFGAEDGFKL